MSRYHFNVHDGVSIPDPEGQELADLEAAKREAVLYSASMIRELDDRFWGGEEWRLEVTDEHGLILFSLLFLGTLSAAGSLSPVRK